LYIFLICIYASVYDPRTCLNPELLVQSFRGEKGRSLFVLLQGKGTRLFVDVQVKGRDSIFFLFPGHIQTILFPSLYILTKQFPCLHNYKQTCFLFPQELRTRSTRFLLRGLISLVLVEFYFHIT
jgi:hypothetical protein